MSQYDNLKATIALNVYQNHNNEVTANMVKAAMDAMTDSLGAGYQYLGIATPTSPGTAQTPDQKVFYIATTPGTYTYLGGLVVNDGEVAVLKWDTAWHKEVTGAATAAQVTELGQKLFVKEIYLNPAEVDVNDIYHIGNIARNVTGIWYIEINNSSNQRIGNYYSTSGEDNGMLKLYNNIDYIIGYIMVNWDVFPNGVQKNVNIPLNNYFNKELNPRYFIQNELDNYKFLLFYGDTSSLLPGYAETNNTQGEAKVNVGDTIVFNPEFLHTFIPCIINDVFFIPDLPTTAYTIAFPVIVDKAMTVLEIKDITTLPLETINGANYRKLVCGKDGYLLISTTAQTLTLYTSTPGTKKQVNLSVPRPNYFDYSVAVNMEHGELIALIESASNGACTVKYDSNGYPSLMYRIPLTSIGSLAPELGGLDTPHPAFVVNGVQKKHIYAGVFMNADYNGVPVSWWGLENILTSKSFAQCRSLCAAKGSGWHLETIWERSLISLLTRKYHNTDIPRGNNERGRSGATGFEYECVEGYGNWLPGDFPNGGKWINGTQPEAWSHNNSRWGIFDVIGAFHEWINLAKVDTNGKIYICADNNFNGDESEWIDTGVYITLVDDTTIVYDTAAGTPVSSIVSKQWRDAICSANYNNISEALRKKLTLAILCPRLLSTDAAALFNFDGTIWIRNGIGDCYPFMGGAEEYPSAGLGFVILSYDQNEAHNNMGSRLFYID